MRLESEGSMVLFFGLMVQAIDSRCLPCFPNMCVCLYIYMCACVCVGLHVFSTGSLRSIPLSAERSDRHPQWPFGWNKRSLNWTGERIIMFLGNLQREHHMGLTWLNSLWNSSLDVDDPPNTLTTPCLEPQQAASENAFSAAEERTSNSCAIS